MRDAIATQKRGQIAVSESNRNGCLQSPVIFNRNRCLQSPLNYTGGKFKLLGQLLPHFPANMDSFVDLFCGGGNVGINVSAGRIFLNDNNPRLIRLFETFRQLGADAVTDKMNENIRRYGLSNSNDNGYAFYGCNGSNGLASFNREPFLKLRADFNAMGEDDGYYVMLYTLIVFAFNNQIRFNGKGEYNLPVGKRDFNSSMKAKLRSFTDRLREKDYKFSCKDFRAFDTSALTGNSFVYCDPPYLITCASYNERDGWNEQAERDLLAFLDGLNGRGIKFALSNVLSSKGKTNEILKAWAEKYRVIHLAYKYSNSNYHRKDRGGTEDEVLITNYGGDKCYG